MCVHSTLDPDTETLEVGRTVTPVGGRVTPVYQYNFVVLVPSANSNSTSSATRVAKARMIPVVTYQ